jgi:hypothetical protein
MRFYALRVLEDGLIRSDPKKLLAKGTDWRFILGRRAGKTRPISGQLGATGCRLGCVWRDVGRQSANTQSGATTQSRGVANAMTQILCSQLGTSEVIMETWTERYRQAVLGRASMLRLLRSGMAAVQASHNAALMNKVGAERFVAPYVLCDALDAYSIPMPGDALPVDVPTGATTMKRH